MGASSGFLCLRCGKLFTLKQNLSRHEKSCTSMAKCPESFSCVKCQKSFSRTDNLRNHMMRCSEKLQNTSAVKRSHTPSSSQINDEEVGESSNKKKKTNSTAFCDVCKEHIQSYIMQGHYRSLKHKENSSRYFGAGVQEVTTAFKSRIVTYRVSIGDNFAIDVKGGLNSIKHQILNLINDKINVFKAVKVNMEIFGIFVNQSKELEEIKSFNTKNKIVNEGSNFEDLYQTYYSIVLETKISEFLERESGWVLSKLLFLEININKYNPVKASSYVRLPAEIIHKRAVLNIQNNDNECFKWCVLAAIHHIEKKDSPNRVSHYKPFENELNFTGVTFAVQLSQIGAFEEQNNISINVYGLDRALINDKYTYEVVGPLHFTNLRRATHVNLLLISDEMGNNHFCLIRNLSRLVGQQLSKHKAASHLCDGCLLNFDHKEKLMQHQKFDCNHVYTVLPSTQLKKDKYGNDSPKNILKFENFERKLKVPFVIYADFESILKPISTCEPSSKNSFTIPTYEHIPHSFAYNIVCSFDDSLSKYVTYRGMNAGDEFVKSLESDCKYIYKNYIEHVIPMTPLTAEQEDIFRTSLTCHICERPFNQDDEKVRKHCHLSGNFTGAAHSVCNLNFKIPQFIPIFTHNLSNYDLHLFIKNLAGDKTDLSVIPQNKERYISVTKKITVEKYGNHDVHLQLRFLDSFRFMPSSLEKLALNLKPDQCVSVKKYFPDRNSFELIRQKGVFPYSFIDSFEKLNNTSLPSKSHFFDKLRNVAISEDDYKHAVNVWSTFNCKTLGDYSDIYLKSDVLLLTDIFESFRNVCINTYSLDPAHYYTAPGLSWDAMLKYTSVQLELLTDFEMVAMLKSSIRGGLSQCSGRKAKANNKYIPDFDRSKPSNFISYLDATNLYGKAMSEPLPLGDFRWLDKEEIQTLNICNIKNNSSKGYILEVDLEYPKDLHDKHNDLPFCPESIISPQSKTKVSKLIANLNNKSKYVIHYQNLKQAIENGLKVTRVHRILEFSQSCWLKKYIDLNTNMRNAATSKFEKDFFKLMVNSIYGKTCENVEKRVDVRLITHWENLGKRLGAEALISRPNFKTCSIFNDNFVAIHMEKLKVFYNKPIYVGFSVLEISKTIMYDFYYSYIKSKYEDKAKLLYIDTDSLILDIECTDFYQDIAQEVHRFDTSNYSVDNKYNIPVNASVVGKMKDEYAGKVIYDFYGTGAKAYCVNVNGEFTKRAKGVSQYVTKTQLSIDDYEYIVDNVGSSILKKMSSFRSRLHTMYTELKNKVALSYYDDKRYIIGTCGRTLAWGHKNIP